MKPLNPLNPLTVEECIKHIDSGGAVKMSRWCQKGKAYMLAESVLGRRTLLIHPDDARAKEINPKVTRVTEEGRVIYDPASVVNSRAAKKHLRAQAALREKA